MLHTSCPAGQHLQPQPADAASPPAQPAFQMPAAAPVAVPQPAAATPPGTVKAGRVRVAPSATAEERRLAAVLSEAEAFTAELRCGSVGAWGQHSLLTHGLRRGPHLNTSMPCTAVPQCHARIRCLQPRIPGVTPVIPGVPHYAQLVASTF